MEKTGRLSVRVYTSQAEIPLQGATVVVTGRGKDGRNQLISVQVTDRSGLIQPVEIAAPPPADSTSPQEAGKQAPFSLCSVWAEHPGYAMLQAAGVQIFPGVETVQDMMLIPLGEGESSLQHRGTRDITAQSL